METVFTPAYCDYIAKVIKEALAKDASQMGSLLCGPGRINYHLDIRGALVSTKKTIFAADINGRLYEITIKEA